MCVRERERRRSELGRGVAKNQLQKRKKRHCRRKRTVLNCELEHEDQFSFRFSLLERQEKTRMLP